MTEAMQVWEGAGSALIGCLGVQTQTTLVQMAALRTGHHYLCGGLVFAILPSRLFSPSGASPPTTAASGVGFSATRPN